MGKQRMINTDLWRTSEKFRSCDPLERYMFLFLVTNHHVNLGGAYQMTIDEMGFYSGIDYRTVPQMLERLESVGLAYYREGWVLIPNYVTKMNLNNVKVRSGVEKCLSEVPEHLRGYLSMTHDESSIGHDESSMTHDESRSLTSDSDSDSDYDSDYESTAHAAPAPKKPSAKRVSADTTINIQGDELPINSVRYQNLCKEYGEQAVVRAIEGYVNWEVSHNKRPSRDYARSATNWLRRSWNQKPQGDSSATQYVDEPDDIFAQIKAGRGA